MTPKRISIAAGGVALVTLLVVGLVQLASSSPAPVEPSKLTLAQMRVRLAGSPAPLAALHAQANELLPGGSKALRARLAALRGRPIVINKWASWCGPCRAELPILQQVSTEHGKQIAFVGVNARDKRPAAEQFAAQYPVPYPSYEDPGEKIASSLKAPANFPVTVFLDANGKTVFIHQGGYRSAADLNADIEKYLS